MKNSLLSLSLSLLEFSFSRLWVLNYSRVKNLLQRLSWSLFLGKGGGKSFVIVLLFKPNDIKKSKGQLFIWWRPSQMHNNAPLGFYLLFCNFLLLKFHTSDKLIHFTVGGNKRAECLKPGGCYLQVWEQRKQLGLSFKCCLWSFAIEKLSWRVWGVDGRVWRRGREGREMEKMQTCSLGSHGVPASFGVLCHPSLIIWGSSPKL